MASLTKRERRFLAAMLPNGTVATGSSTGHDLYRRGFVQVVRFGRYGLTPAGEEMIRRFPESNWKLPQDEPRRPRPNR